MTHHVRYFSTVLRTKFYCTCSPPKRPLLALDGGVFAALAAKSPTSVTTHTPEVFCCCDSSLGNCFSNFHSGIRPIFFQMASGGRLVEF